MRMRSFTVAAGRMCLQFFLARAAVPERGGCPIRRGPGEYAYLMLRPNLAFSSSFELVAAFYVTICGAKLTRRDTCAASQAPDVAEVFAARFTEAAFPAVATFAAGSSASSARPAGTARATTPAFPTRAAGAAGALALLLLPEEGLLLLLRRWADAGRPAVLAKLAADHVPVLLAVAVKADVGQTCQAFGTGKVMTALLLLRLLLLGRLILASTRGPGRGTSSTSSRIIILGRRSSRCTGLRPQAVIPKHLQQGRLAARHRIESRCWPTVVVCL